MFRKRTDGVLMIELLLAVVVAGIVVSMAMELPVTLTRFLQKIDAGFNYQLDKVKLFEVLEQDVSTAFQPIFFSSEEIKTDDPLQSAEGESSDAKKINENKNEAVKDKPGQQGQDTSENLVADEKAVLKKSALKKFFLVNNQTVDAEMENQPFKSLCFFCTNNFESMSKQTSRFNAIFYLLEEDSSSNQTSTQKLYKLVRYDIKNYFDFDKLDFSKLDKSSEVQKSSVVLAKKIKAITIDVRLKNNVKIKDESNNNQEITSAKNGVSKESNEDKKSSENQNSSKQDNDKKELASESDVEQKLRDARLPCAVKFNILIDDRGVDMLLTKTILVWNGFYLPEVQKDRVKQKGGFKITPKMKQEFNSIMKRAENIVKTRYLE